MSANVLATSALKLAGQVVRLPKVVVLVPLYHELVHNHRLPLRDGLCRIDAEAIHTPSALQHGDRAHPAGDPVHTLRKVGAGDIEIAIVL